MMAGATLVETVQITSSHDPCLSPSLGWLSPRISFSKDFAQSEGADKTDSRKGKEKVDRDSMPDFEFSMSMLEYDSSAGSQMLAADELFFKGKLLPLYVPQYTEGSEERSTKGVRKDGEQEKVSIRKSAGEMPVTVASTVSASVDLHSPTSPKTPRCSTKLKELLGLKRSKFQGLQETCKSRDHQQRTPVQQKSLLASKSKRFFCRSDDAKAFDARNSGAGSKSKRLFCRSDDNKLLDARNSTEPLLGSTGEAHGSGSSCAVSSRPQQTNQNPHRTSLDKKASVPILCSPFSSTAPHRVLGSAVQRNEGGLGPQLRVKVRGAEQKLRASRRSEDYCRAMEAASRLEYGSRSGARSRRPSTGSGRGSGETSPARRSGATSPSGSSGRWSPGRHSGVWSPGRSSGGLSPGRLSLGECYGDSGRYMQSRRLERSSSSPNSLRKRYDHLKAVRQRDGWRGLERSSSYSSVRVTPVLNVPVCMSPGLRSGGAGGRGSSKSNGGFGLGILFGAATSKVRDAQTPAAVAASAAPRTKPKLSRRPASSSSIIY